MRGKKGVYMLIKIFHKKENKIMQERVAFFKKNTLLDEIKEDVTPSLIEAHVELSLGQ